MSYYGNQLNYKYINIEEEEAKQYKLDDWFYGIQDGKYSGDIEALREFYLTMSEIQAVIYSSNIWHSPSEALKHLQTHLHLTPFKYNLEGTQHRFRIHRPTLYKRFTTKKLKNGISLVLGWRT
jgi:hypothetical protein